MGIIRAVFKVRTLSGILGYGPANSVCNNPLDVGLIIREMALGVKRMAINWRIHKPPPCMAWKRKCQPEGWLFPL